MVLNAGDMGLRTFTVKLWVALMEGVTLSATVRVMRLVAGDWAWVGRQVKLLRTGLGEAFALGILTGNV